MPLPNSPLQESYQRLLPPRPSNDQHQMQLVPYVIGTRIAPVVATTVVIATLITCVSIVKAKDIYLGGLAWPYFSDTGRGETESAVSVAGSILRYESVDTRTFFIL